MNIAAIQEYKNMKNPLFLLVMALMMPFFAEGYAPLPYRIYRSDKAESMTRALPLVVFLHGAGERGNDNG